MITPDQIRAARALLNKSNANVANDANISVNTLTRAEQGLVKPSTMNLLQKSLEKSGIEFLPENGAGVGVRLKK